MRKITEKGLRKHLGERVKLVREGIRGNSRYIDGRIKEGELLGILQEDENGFYVRMFKTIWNSKGTVIIYSTFLEELYRVGNFDIIDFSTGTYSVRINNG